MQPVFRGTLVWVEGSADVPGEFGERLKWREKSWEIKIIELNFWSKVHFLHKADNNENNNSFMKKLL
jgi:hypothetical protein